MDNYNDPIKVLVKCTVDATKKLLAKARFDRTSIGVITDISGNVYTVAVFGGTYSIQSSQLFNINQRVAVTAPQNDFKHLLLRPI